MCIIVDANVANDFAVKSPDAVPVLKWLLTGQGALVAGGKLTEELARTKFKETLIELDRAGRLRNQDKEKLEAASTKIANRKQCRSNDVHIIAAAVVSGCRLIYTKDKNLQKDMKDRSIVKPVASIYTSHRHYRLLTPCVCK